jgi:hypothetical protein
LKDLLDRLNSGDFIIDAYRIIDGPQDERQWRYPNGDKLGKTATRYNAPSIVRYPVVNAGMRGLVHNNFPTWIERAKKGFTPTIQKTSVKDSFKKEVTESDVRDVGRLGDMLVEIDKYMNKLKDNAEIGALYKFRKHLTQKVKK